MYSRPLLSAVPYRSPRTEQTRETSNSRGRNENTRKKNLRRKTRTSTDASLTVNGKQGSGLLLLLLLLRSFHRSIIGRFENTWTPVRVHFGATAISLFPTILEHDSKATARKEKRNTIRGVINPPPFLLFKKINK